MFVRKISLVFMETLKTGAVILPSILALLLYNNLSLSWSWSSLLIILHGIIVGLSVFLSYMGAGMMMFEKRKSFEEEASKNRALDKVGRLVFFFSVFLHLLLCTLETKTGTGLTPYFIPEFILDFFSPKNIGIKFMVSILLFTLFFLDYHKTRTQEIRSEKTTA